MHIRDLKTQLRTSIHERMARMDAKDRAAESRSVCRRILEALPAGPATVCAYVPLKDEVDVRPLLLTFFERGDAVFLPRFENGKLAFRRAESLDLPKGALNIPEPLESAALLSPQELQFVLVPGRAFDKQGWRLGRGNGGYDIWISEQRKLNPRTLYWGIAFESQIVTEVPHEEHDEKLDAIVTARGLSEMKN